MAIILADRYPGRAGPKTLDYPQGSFKNRTSPTAKDGTYLEEDWANDMLAFFQSLIKEAGMTANGVVDTAQASQYFDALGQILDDSTPDASEEVRGMLEIATAAEAQALTDDSRALTPAKLAAAFGGGNQGLTDNGYQKLPGGFILQWGSVSVSRKVGINSTAFTFPVAFPNKVWSIASSMGTSEPDKFQESITGASLSGGTAYVNATHTSGLVDVKFIAVGN